jgi:hypothetical protein
MCRSRRKTDALHEVGTPIKEIAAALISLTNYVAAIA